MPIHIIVDGYNIIRNSPDLEPLDRQDIQLGREALVKRLAAYKRMKPHRITVVFDGANAPIQDQRMMRIHGIDIRFSRRGESADTVIQNMVRKEREKALVVSSDREVIRQAESSRASSISSQAFDQKLMLAEYVSVKGGGDDASGWRPTTQKKGPSRRLPKRKRQLRSKLKKL